MDAEQIAAELSEAEKGALVPFLTFSKATGVLMERKGLLHRKDGVWGHTPLGMQVRAILEKADG